ncbi:MAG TPA: 3-hydroxyacyl-CoA dehydrogenase NAD-binding domain-containing protein, partial [Solirubrobacteraceae bacterium]
MKREPDELLLGADRRVTVVGAGLMGSQIGCEYAIAGCALTWVVRDRSRAAQRIEQALALALRHRL